MFLVSLVASINVLSLERDQIFQLNCPEQEELPDYGVVSIVDGIRFDNCRGNLLKRANGVGRDEET